MIAFENDRRTRAEQFVIASLMQDDLQVRHCSHLCPSDFSHDAHGTFFRGIALARKHYDSVNPLTVRVALFHAWHRDLTQSECSYLAWLEAMHVVPCHVGVYAAAMLEDDES